MNAQLQESTEVAVIQPKPLTVIERAMSVFVGVPSEESLRELAKGSATITEITNQAGWDQCHAARMVLKNTRLEISRTGEAGREDAVQTSRSIIAIQKSRIAITQGEEDRLAAIEQAWDDRIAAEKEARIQAEIARVARLQERVTELRGCQTLSPSSGSTLVLEHIADLEAIPVDASFEEFEQQASDAKTAALVRLKGILGAAVAHEAEQAKIIAERAELAKLRAEQADRDRLAAAAQAKADAAAQVERDRVAKEAHDKQVADAREHAETIRKDRERIAQEEANAKVIRDTETKRLADERAENARKAAERQAELDAQAEAQRLANAAEARRPADQQAEIDRQQEEIRRANEPKLAPAAQEAPTPAPPSAQPENWPITDAQLVTLVMTHCGVGRIKADRRIRDYGKK